MSSLCFFLILFESGNFLLQFLLLFADQLIQLSFLCWGFCSHEYFIGDSEGLVGTSLAWILSSCTCCCRIHLLLAIRSNMAAIHRIIPITVELIGVFCVYTSKAFFIKTHLARHALLTSLFTNIGQQQLLHLHFHLSQSVFIWFHFGRIHFNAVVWYLGLAFSLNGKVFVVVSVLNLFHYQVFWSLAST